MEPALARYRAGDHTGALDVFMRNVVAANWKSALARTIPGSPEQAERDVRTVFEIEGPALNEWKFDPQSARTISQPILHVVGSESLAMFQEIGKVLHSWFPQQVEDLTVPGVAHGLHQMGGRHSAAVAEGIATFLRRHPHRRRDTLNTLTQVRLGQLDGTGDTRTSVGSVPTFLIFALAPRSPCLTDAIDRKGGGPNHEDPNNQTVDQRCDRRLRCRRRRCRRTCSDATPVFRSYTSFSQAAVENAHSRILIGFHFRKSEEEGTEYGRKIGKRAANLYLRPVH